MLSFATCRNWAGAPGTRPPAQHDAQERGGWLTFFSYAEYELVCTVTPGDSYYVQATTWDSGDGVRYPKHFPRYPASNCVPELAGSGIDDDHYKAATFDAGFDLGKPIGFAGSAQTGWTKDAHIKYDCGVSGASCGTNNFPPNAAAIIAT